MPFNAAQHKFTQTDADTKGNYGKPDVPGLSTAAMQRLIDSLATHLGMERYNRLIEQMEAELLTEAEIRALIPEPGPGDGDMKAAVYDPTGKREDVFAYADDKAGAALTAASGAQTTANTADTKAAKAIDDALYAKDLANAALDLAFKADDLSTRLLYRVIELENKVILLEEAVYGRTGEAAVN